MNTLELLVFYPFVLVAVIHLNQPQGAGTDINFFLWISSCGFLLFSWLLLLSIVFSSVFIFVHTVLSSVSLAVWHDTLVFAKEVASSKNIKGFLFLCL